MNVVLPNGKVIKGVPEGTTKEQIAEKAIAAGLATRADFGMTEQAKQPEPEQTQDKSFLQSASDLVTGSDRQTDSIANLQEVTGSPEFGGISGFFDDKKSGFEALSELYDKGLTKQAFKSAAGFLTTSDPKEQIKIIQSNYPNAKFTTDEKDNVIVSLGSGDYVLNAPGISTSDLTNLVGQAALFTPAARAGSILGAGAASAATQAGIEGAGELTGGEFDGAEVALAGALGGGLKAAENLAGGAFRAIRGDVEPEKAQLIRDIESQGIKARTSDILPPETLPGKLAQSVGEANPIGTAGQQAQQQQAREVAAQEYVDKYIPSFEEIKSSIKGKRKKIEEKALDARQFALDAAEDVPLVTTETIKKIDEQIEELTTLPNGQPRQKVDQSAVDELEKYKSDVANSTNINDLSNLRTTFRDDLNPKFGERSNRREGAIKQIYGAMTKDMDETIKQAVTPNQFRQYKQGNAVYGREAENLKKGRIRKLLQAGEDLSPEQITQKLLSKDTVIRDQLYKSLDQKGRENARAAIIQELAAKASKSGELSVNQFLNRLNDNQKAINTFFRGDNRKELEGLKRALDATRSAQDAAVNPPTGQRLAPYLIGGGAVADLGLTLLATGATGAFSRAYQTKPVRNALLKIANTPKGSTKFEEALEELNLLLLGVTQSQASAE